MARGPELIGLCPNRAVEGSRYLNVQVLGPTDKMVCEACGGPLIVYERAEFDDRRLGTVRYNIDVPS